MTVSYLGQNMCRHYYWKSVFADVTDEKTNWSWMGMQNRSGRIWDVWNSGTPAVYRNWHGGTSICLNWIPVIMILHELSSKCTIFSQCSAF